MGMVVLEERLSGPHIPLLIDELLQLRIIRDKVDHPRKGSKDLADAVCGAVYNSISRTRMRHDEEIKIHDYDSMSYDNDFGVSDGEVENVYNMIRAPRMPESLAKSIENMEII